MRLKSVDDGGNATVEFHCEELMMLVALKQDIAKPIKDDPTGSIVTYSYLMDDTLLTIGILAKLCIEDVDHEKVNAMLAAEPERTAEDFITDIQKRRI